MHSSPRPDISDKVSPAPRSEELGQALINYFQANPMPDQVKLVEYNGQWCGDGLEAYVAFHLHERRGEKPKNP